MSTGDLINKLNSKLPKNKLIRLLIYLLTIGIMIWLWVFLLGGWLIWSIWLKVSDPKSRITMTGVTLVLTLIFGILWVQILTVTRTPNKQIVYNNITSTPVLATRTPTPSREPILSKDPTQAPTVSNVPVPKNSLELINEIVRAQVKIEPTVFSGDNFADETNAPYNVIINLPFDHSIYNCFMAKKLSVELVKSLYSDETVRTDLQRVLVSIPYYLGMSLGASDGVSMAEKNLLQETGPTVFWNTMESMGLSEKEYGNLEDRTWGVLLQKCE